MSRLRSGLHAVGHRRLRSLVVALALLGLPACGFGELRLYGPVTSSGGKPFPVMRVRSVAYYCGPGEDRCRHRLDLFLPRGLSHYPVVLLVHGGAWTVGNNRCSGLYTSVGEFLASQGIAAALPNYRLSPGVQHPEHVKDVARAFAWVHSHIADLGGSPERIFVAGHSAGGHLAALLATDERYLLAEGLHTADVRGVISVCGVYDIPPGSVEFLLGGKTLDSLRLDEFVPFRGVCDGWGMHLPGLPMHLNVYRPAFGDDERVREDASPLNHVRPGLPPFLLLSAEKDLPTLRVMAIQFHQALREQGCEAYYLTIPRRNHNSIMFRAVDADDPVACAMVEFVHEHSGAHLPLR